ncbi:SRPBCC family protein [Bdellovibrio sp. HCB337]|uniref:SRPBCC family protein n=1 Tax=Bdellovibrio sp. HCB337 TaxID=3394358 RepID=UPI0039A694B3
MKKVLIALGVIVGVFLILGLIAPSEMNIEREIVIAKPKDVIFAQLKQLKTHNSWSPWAKRDPNIQMEYRGEDGTVGFISAWSGNDDVGVGEQEIKNIIEGERIDLELRFKKPMEDTSAAYLITEAVDATQTKVKWGMKGKYKFPMNVICMLLNLKKVLIKDFDEGLASMKTYMEKL